MGLILAAGTSVLAEGVDTKDATQQAFDSPKDAVDHLLTACKNNDTPALIRMFGPRLRDAVANIDDAEEKAHRRTFWERSQAHLKLIEKGTDCIELVIGKDLWEFPIPLVKQGRGWVFATDEGFEELLARRIGENELNAISVCREYTIAQREYASADRDDDEVLEYAQCITSTTGKHDGLYWEVKAESKEPLSPLGNLLARAEEPLKDRKPGSPYLGYYFRILTRQGPNPPGGAYDYVINGNMIGGFALIAWPADYRASGVMTFVISHQGKVFEKDIGPDTAKRVEAMNEYNPDKTWTVVKP
jgi:hypothetical protein